MVNYRLSLGMLICSLMEMQYCIAAIHGQIGPQVFGTVKASEDFESFSQLGYESPLTTADYVFTGASTTNGFYVGPSTFMPNATDGLYQNGGFQGRLSIRHADGSDIDQIQFQIGHGSFLDNFYAWVEAFNNGVSTGYSFNFDVAPGSTISLSSQGTVFDEVRIGTYYTATDRNQHIETNYSATSIDNLVTSSGIIPEPQAVFVWALLTACGLVVNTKWGSRTR